jgi:hypothetical protein
MKVLVFDLLACSASLDHLKGGGPELPCRWRKGNFPGCDTANAAVPERTSRAPTPKVRFASDSLLEGNGFELPVPCQ